MLGVVLLLLSSSSPGVAVPPPNAPCSRCCDQMPPAEGSGDPPTLAEFGRVPEIRTYINMTILKGMFSFSAADQIDGLRRDSLQKRKGVEPMEGRRVALY